jgi:ABC-2 type transport system permease protein
LIGALTGSRGLALGIASAAAAISYVLGLLAPSIDWLRPARYASPYFYAVGDKQIQHGLPITFAAILAGAAVIFGAAAVFAFERLDVR